VARQSKSKQPDVIEEIEGLAERAAQWIREHLPLTIGALIAILATAASLSGLGAYRTREAETASDALDRATRAYLEAMGAGPGALAAPELANPDAAAEIRAEYAAQFGAIASEHAGTVAGALARLEAGNLAEAAGDLDSSIEIWQAAQQDLDDASSLQAVLQLRIGQGYEEAERWVEAGEAYEAAAAFEHFPLRYWAMADAARSFLQAGESEHARELALRLHSESPADLNLPEHQRAMLQELRQAHTR
jgi:tetratricopeptide (TPR) repeat protein